MNWYGNRRNEKYIFRRVAWENWQEAETYNYITSGNVELSTEAELKSTGSFEFEGYDIPNVNDLIRLYYSFEDSNREEAYEPIATLFVNYAELTYTETSKGVEAQGTLEGSSVLSVLANKITGIPRTFKANSNAVYEAERLIIECGLMTRKEPSGFSLSADHTFDADATYLEMVNWLLETAGYAQAFPDAMGVVQLKSLASIQNNIDYIVFRNDELSIMYPEILEENEWQTAPNVVRLIYNTDSAYVVAEARNESGSRSSLDARGNREITYFDEISELGAGNKAESLKQLAEETLREQSCETEYVSMEHAYIPIDLYQPVWIDYSDMSWDGFADNISIELEPGTRTQTKIKKALYQNITVKSAAAAIR